MASLVDVPVEVLQDVLFPLLPPKELLRLSRASKFFSALCSSEAVWKCKLLIDFNYTGAGTARTTGWKVLYRGLHRPKVYVWGESENGRLGVVSLPKTSLYHGVPFPVRLPFPSPKTRLVSLSAGGTSFYALDSEGYMHAWGTLVGGLWALPDSGFSDPGMTARTPHKLLMPNPIRSISCGRLHVSAMDSQNKLWTFVNWGRPFSITSPVLRDPLSPPVQVECGWTFSAVLLASGDVFVWWPFDGALSTVIRKEMSAMDSTYTQQASPTWDREIPCITWQVDSVDLAKLPPLPRLPTLENTGLDPSEYPPRLVQIAGLDCRIVGLTDQGHVLLFGEFSNTTTLRNARWEYLPNFSDIDSVGQHQAFQGQAAPTQMKITHVTGSFRNFVAYSTGPTSLVLIGGENTTAHSSPDIKPELQNRSVISVAIGDWHNAALTADGKVLTWGKFSSGALGLGDPAKLPPGAPGAYTNGGRGEPRSVGVPTEVRFDYELLESKDRFAFAITAAGWHTGALVIDPDGVGDEDEEAVISGATGSIIGSVDSSRAGPSIRPSTPTPPVTPRRSNKKRTRRSRRSGIL